MVKILRSPDIQARLHEMEFEVVAGSPREFGNWIASETRRWGKVVKDILLIVKDLRSRGMGLLLVEQNVGIAAEITDRAYVMALGRIVHEIASGEWQSFLGDERLVKAYLGS